MSLRHLIHTTCRFCCWWWYCWRLWGCFSSCICCCCVASIVNVLSLLLFLFLFLLLLTKIKLPMLLRLLLLLLLLWLYFSLLLLSLEVFELFWTPLGALLLYEHIFYKVQYHHLKNRLPTPVDVPNVHTKGKLTFVFSIQFNFTSYQCCWCKYSYFYFVITINVTCINFVRVDYL